MAQHKKKSLVIEQPVPMRKQVYQHLRNQILNHTIEPSSRLVEAQIANEIGISRTPVREALHLLEKDGFVESIPRVGYRVRQLAWEELDEIFEIRRVNELLACRWAVQRINPKSIRALEDNLQQARSALGKGKPNAFLEYDEEFHEILVRSTGSRHLLELCQQLRRLMLRYRAASLRSVQTVETALDDHYQILACLKNKDEKGLEAALDDHLRRSKKDIQSKAFKQTMAS
ncbi:MAG: GntR family transcriptional regulator [Desulfobacterales bacterium]